MRLRIPTKSARAAIAGTRHSPAAQRDRLALLAAVATVIALAAALLIAKDARFLMPGPLASAHASIENCNACHAASGGGKLGWLHGLVSGDHVADSKACLGCHQMPDTALNPHAVAMNVLDQSTQRLSAVAARTPAPSWAYARSFPLPADRIFADGLSCATCHQDHRGSNADLKRIADRQCQTCHVLKFDGFEAGHPSFSNYPFRRRTRIVYDHAGHLDKHFPEVAAKDPAKAIPSSCTSCHDSSKDRRVMAVAPFEKTCAACHLDQIRGKDRVSGPKGLPFLAVPGLDLKTLRQRKADIGEWPESAEAGLTPFMKLLIARNEAGRSLLKTVERLDLQDLSKASAGQIQAVTSLVWEIKQLWHNLLRATPAEVLGGLELSSSGTSDAPLKNDLVAAIPLDVIVSAQQQWLPNLAAEMSARQQRGQHKQAGWLTTIAPSIPDNAGAGIGARDNDGPEAAQAKAAKAANPKLDAAPAAPSGKPETSAKPPSPHSSDQSDDLLNPTPQELQAIKSRSKPPAAATGSAASKTASVASGDPRPPGSASPDAPSHEARSPPRAPPAPTPTITTDVDPESWAELGGWYRQDYAINYRPSGHKDRFIASWLRLLGPRAANDIDATSAAAFNTLTGKDAQGACTKCHSVDDRRGAGRIVNFSPMSAASKQSRFTTFVHEPHFGVVKDGGCLNCHDLAKGKSYLQSYQHGDPSSHASNFAPVEKERCQTCHNTAAARQDCLTCHKYHVERPRPPTLHTTIPAR